MRIDDPNLPDLRVIAQSLGDLCEQVVFLGGAVAGLLVTDPLADPVRATRDVDAVVNADRAHFFAIEKQLATRGFARDVQSDVICRWVHKASGVLFDLMPVAPEVLGFSNFWYPYAVQSALPVYLGEGITIRLVSAVAFVATKLEAFASRGGGDLLGSHDLEDVLNIVDGRAELLEEFSVAPAALQQAVGTVFSGLLANSDFINVLPGMLAEPERTEWVLGQLRALSR